MKLTPQQIAWLKGLEKFVGAAVVMAVFEYLKAGDLPHDKAGWLKFGGIAGGAAYSAVRLYMSKSPLTGTTTPAQPQQ